MHLQPFAGGHHRRSGTIVRRGLARSAIVVVVLAVAATSCALPTNVAPFPYFGPYGSEAGVNQEAQRISDALLAYIVGWYEGRNPAEIPNQLLPDSQRGDAALNRMTLMKGTPDPTKQFMTRKAAPVDVKASPGAFPDPFATYIVSPNLFVPFGTKIQIDGQYPKARFMDIQATPSFYARDYRFNAFGGAETAIVDADIEPNWFSGNPFRVGATRSPWLRDYAVTMTAAMGNPATLDPAMKPPYRGAGNHRFTSGIQFRGPWGDPGFNEPSPFADHKGMWTWGEMWLRYYANDTAAGPLGGVPLPRMTFTLPDGKQFWIATDYTAQSARVNQTSAVPTTAPADPPAGSSARGWTTNWGILRGGMQAYADVWGLPAGYASSAEYARTMDKAIQGRGEDVAAPGNYQTSATLSNYNVYLNKGMSLGPGKVFVLTGKLPTAPKTQAGNPTMTAGQIRYVNFSTYNVSDITSPTFGQAITTVMDEQMPVDANGYFCIVYSRPADKPTNLGPKCKWIDWGPMASVVIMARYLTVGPEWTSPKIPTETLTGRKTDGQSTSYQPGLLDVNNQSGFMGEYHPIAHYMTKAQFQALGTVNAKTMGYTSGW